MSDLIDVPDEAVEADMKAHIRALCDHRSKLRDRIHTGLTAAYPVLRRQVEAYCAAKVEALCDWRYGADNGAEPAEQHSAYHFGHWPGQSGVCPYAAMAAVLRGQPDPRRIASDQGGEGE